MPAALRDGRRPGDLAVRSLLALGEASPLRRVLNPQPSRNLRVETIAGVGHFLPEEAPDEVLDLVLPFLAEGGVS